MSDSAKAVFLSYASQDAEAAKRIADALRASGIEVWFDQNELVGGDQWDTKIRGQIASCALFVPVISAATQARGEGYFRLEWKLAVDRSHLMAHDQPFLLPVVIDATPDAAARVPAEFRAVQWTRLPDGETPVKFCARVQRLLGGRVDTSHHDSLAVPAPGLRQKQPAPVRRWLIPILIGVLGIATAGLWFSQKSSPNPPPPVGNAAMTAPRSSAHQLITQAWEQLNRPEQTRAQLDAANALCQRAIELDPLDAGAWAAWSQVDSWYVWHHWDDLPLRREGARTKAAKAMQLSPLSYEARLAQACQLVRSHGGAGFEPLYAKEAEDLLRRLLHEQPAEPQALWALGQLLRDTKQSPEMRAVFNQLAQNPAFAATALNELAWAEYLQKDTAAAERAVDASIAVQPFWGNLSLKASIAMRWRGDLDQAKDTLNRMPAEIRQDDLGILSFITLYYWRREPDHMLRVLNSVSRDWLKAVNTDAPKAYFAALAHELAGHDEAAKQQWSTALRLVEDRQGAQSDDGDLLHLKAQILLKLSRQQEGEATLRLAHEMGGPESNFRLVQDQIWLGNFDAAMALLEPATEKTRLATTALRLSPDYDPLRKLPRFQALLARIEADPDGSLTTTPAPGSHLSLAPSSDKSIAVLAFANMSADADNEYFSDGISEELLNVLAKISGLKVTARTSAFHFKGKDTPIPEIARQLGVAYVVEGSVRRAGDRVRITAQLIKADDGFHVWSDTFDRDLKDIFAVQDEIAGLVAQQLSLKLSASSVASTAAVNPQAFELYVQARQAWNARTASNLQKAEDLLVRALELEPSFARAHAALADVWLMRETNYIGRSDSPEYARVEGEVMRALQLDSDLGEAHASLGLLRMSQWRLKEAKDALGTAIRLNPNYASARQWLSACLVLDGRMDEALKEAKSAAETDPYAPRILTVYAARLHETGQLNEALVYYERALSLQPDDASALRRKITVLSDLGRHEEAIKLAQQAMSDDPSDLERAIRMIPPLAAAGRRDEAETLHSGVNNGNVSIFNAVGRASLYLILGRNQQALDALTPGKTTVEGFSRILFDPLFDPIRNHPKFGQFLESLGATEAHARAQAWRQRRQSEKAESKL